MQATSKGSDQTARMHKLILGFAGRTYHIVGNLMSRLNYIENTLRQDIIKEANTMDQDQIAPERAI